MLESNLKNVVQGEVRFDDGSRALYATDASNYRQVPIGVVIPRDAADIRRAVAACREAGAPILSRGAGTSLAGQCCNKAVVLDMSKNYNRLLFIDAKARTARVQPGLVLDHLRAAAEAQGLTFGPDPASHNRCTLGGMIGNNSCGVHALVAGKTVDNVESLNVLTYDGLEMEVGPTSDTELAAILRAGGRRADIYGALRDLRDRYADLIRTRYPKIPRRVSGYNLDELLPENGFNVARALVGTEGTCVMVLEATLRLIPNPAHRSLVVLGYRSVYEAADDVPRLLTFKPIGLEGFDVGMVSPLKRYIGFAGKIAALPPGDAWLLLEFGGDTAEAVAAQARALLSSQGPHVSSIIPTPQGTKDVWAIRESALAATAFIPGERDRAEGWEDAAVPPARLGLYLRELRALYDRFGYHGAFYGHFGDGCVHTRIDFDLESQEGLKQFRAFLDKAADLVVRHGGSLSGEHGDGHARAALLPKMFGPELITAFREFKRIWDPQNKMNPGKIVDAFSPVDHLRMGPDYAPWKPTTHFQLPDDHHDFARASVRCVGVGKCRQDMNGSMCPSYRATRDEAHSTRGRAHLLFEMLRGDFLKRTWRQEAAKEALDLCLACKACKSECPVNVDMATYKAEFLSHYYEGRLRPRQAYVFGWVARWLKLGSVMPRLANAVTQRPLLSSILKTLGGVASQRSIPALAREPFRAWFDARPKAPGAPQRPLLLWPDTFTNHLHPDIGQAAVDVLETLGFHVRIPSVALCCGRPLYDYGMLGAAKDHLREILAALKDDISAGVPLVGLEPSCVSVFRDEMTNLFPDDPLAQRLKEQTYLFGEFLMSPDTASSEGKSPLLAFIARQTPGLVRPGQKVLLHGHCHQKSVLKFEADVQALSALGYDVEAPDSGCCGMAGAFGFEADHYAISQQVAERALLPALRRAAKDTLIATSGFSCAEQIRQSGGKEPLHLAQLIRRAILS